MQTIGGTAAADAIMARTRTFRVRLRVDWNGDGLYTHALSEMSLYVEEISTDRALKGSLPSDILLVEGSAAAELNVSIGGEYNRLSMTSVFSPYNGLSPLYTKDVIGAEIRYDIGLDTALGTVWYPQFIGNISTVTPERGDNSVTIRALDRVEKLRAPMLFPQWALSDYWANRGRKLGQLFDTQQVIQMCLQQADTSASARRPTTRDEYAKYFGSEGYKMLFISGANGHLPTTGWWDNGQAVPISNVEGSGAPNYTKNGPVHPLSPEPTNKPYAFAAYGANTDGIYQKYWMTDRFETSINSEFFLGGVMNISTAFPNGSWHVTAADTVIMNYRLGEKRRVDIMVGSGQMWLRFVNENNSFSNVTPKLNIPTGVDNVEFFAHVDATANSGTRAYMRVGTNSHAGWQYISNGYPGDSNYDALTGLLQINRNMSLSDVCVSVNYVPAIVPAQDEGPLWRVAKYPAVLDAGLNRFSFVPDGLTGKDAWDIITAVAGAEFGSVFWDESGAFHFWNYNTVKSKQSTIVRTIDVDQFTDLKITNSLDSVRNALSVGLKKRQAASSINVYKSNSVDEFYVPASTIAYFDVQVDNVQFMEPRFLQRFTKHTSGAAATAFMSWNEWVTHGYVYQQLFGDGWREPNDASTLDVGAWYTRDGIMRVRIVNFQLNPIRLAVSNQPTVGNADSTPACWIGGTLINDQAALGITTRDNASIGKYGQRNYEATGDWYQEYYNSNGLANVLLSRTTKPIPTTDQITIAGDPRLQLGDTIQLNDSDGLGEQLRAQITGITRKFSISSGLTDVLTVELLRPAGLGIWDSSQYGRWDQSLIWN
jgi:hypothetical protein